MATRLDPALPDSGATGPTVATALPPTVDATQGLRRPSATTFPEERPDEGPVDAPFHRASRATVLVQTAVPTAVLGMRA